MQQPLYHSLGSTNRTLKTNKYLEKCQVKMGLTIIVIRLGHKAARRFLFGKDRQSLPSLESVATDLAATR